MLHNERGLTMTARAGRIILLMVLLICTAGGSCDLIDVIGFPGRTGGELNIIIPLGLGGSAGILNPSANGSSVVPDGDSTTPPSPGVTTTTTDGETTGSTSSSYNSPGGTTF